MVCLVIHLDFAFQEPKQNVLIQVNILVYLCHNENFQLPKIFKIRVKSNKMVDRSYTRKILNSLYCILDVTAEW